MNVLTSNDWEKYRPKVLVVEILHYDRQEIIDYLMAKDYLLVVTNTVNGIFIDQTADWKIRWEKA